MQWSLMDANNTTHVNIHLWKQKYLNPSENRKSKWFHSNNALSVHTDDVVSEPLPLHESVPMHSNLSHIEAHVLTKFSKCHNTSSSISIQTSPSITSKVLQTDKNTVVKSVQCSIHKVTSESSSQTLDMKTSIKTQTDPLQDNLSDICINEKDWYNLLQ